MPKLARLRCLLSTGFVVLALASATFAQQPFNKSEFAARRAKLFEKIPDGINELSNVAAPEVVKLSAGQRRRTNVAPHRDDMRLRGSHEFPGV